MNDLRDGAKETHEVTLEFSEDVSKVMIKLFKI
jgi:hypothetical protein